MTTRSRTRSRRRTRTCTITLLALAAAATGGCLARPVETLDPTTKVSFVTNVKKSSVDKIDLLLMIDNSSSMGDKQAILADAVPDLVNRLVTPNCVDDLGKPNGLKADPNKDATKQCAKGKPEFKPVTDIHVAVVSSSMGGFGSDNCPSSADGRHNDDKARALNRTKVRSEDSNFLAWYPDTEANKEKPLPFGYSHVDTNKYTDATDPTFSAAFADIVTNVGQDGCGLEAQLESFYRFLIQPDPYASVKVADDCLGTDKLAAKPCAATLEGYDDTVLKQRSDFLRPDSLVAVILLTDEDDSSVDPLAFKGAGWGFMNTRFPNSSTVRDAKVGTGTTAARATSECAKNPASDTCTSCAFEDSAGVVANDPNCKESKYYSAVEDSMNVRFFHMKERFGVDPQFPIKRYVDGLLNTKVPDRTSEHDSGGNYVGTPTCVNPLYAQKLPTDSSGAVNGELCNLTVGTRPSENVFFAVIGGVPHQLLSENTASDGSLSKEGWNKVLGKDPASFNYDGIDPHMVQSITPRTGLEGAAPVGSNGSDPYHGREWDTGGNDLQYACTFALSAPKCDVDPVTGACIGTIDCDGKKATPLCSADNSKTQTRAKAYPTIREFQVVRELGSQGIIASLCPENPLTKKLEDGITDDPTYGYRPAVKSIVDRLKDALANTCIPQALERDEKTKEVPCLLLETLAEAGDSCEKHRLKNPDPKVLEAFRQTQKEKAGEASAASTVELPVCEIPQIVKDDPSESCEGDADAGWCYVTNFGKCKQSVLLTASAQVPGSQTYLQCINQFSASADESKSK